MSTKHYHLIGIGGIGMSGIAKLLLRRGYKVSGSDLKETKITEELKDLGAEISIGHSPNNIQGADLIIYSSAIKEDNPERQAAEIKGIPLTRRAEALAKLMEDATVITVSGSHGKTTTASLVSCLLWNLGISPTLAIGGILKNIDTNAYLGDGKFFVAEADESDGSFLCYRPKYSIITNIDREHLDYYKEFKNEIEAFREFINRTEEDGCLFCCDDCPNLKEILRVYKKRYVLFGLKSSADMYPKNIQLKALACEFDCFYKNKFVDRFHLALAGLHNISNALSVVALGIELRIDLGVIKDTLANYKGTQRRLEVKFSSQDYLLLDDYAHHPTEIRATLSALKYLNARRLMAIFQPHRYTRTKLLLEEFGQSFDLADCVIITDIYPAGEPPLEGISGRSIYDKIKKNAPGKEVYFLAKEEITGQVLMWMRPNDLLITLGAGDIVKIADELAEKLKMQDKT